VKFVDEARKVAFGMKIESGYFHMLVIDGEIWGLKRQGVSRQGDLLCEPQRDVVKMSTWLSTQKNMSSDWRLMPAYS
jgi:hypothetical protein